MEEQGVITIGDTLIESESKHIIEDEATKAAAAPSGRVLGPDSQGQKHAFSDLVLEGEEENEVA
jgi:hypothetical protein